MEDIASRRSLTPLRTVRTQSCEDGAAVDPGPIDDRQAGIQALFGRYSDPVYRFIYRQVGNRQDAEDLTSEVFLSASRNLDLSRPAGAIGRWLFTVSRTVIADHWRRHYRLPPLVDVDELQLAEIAPQPDAGNRQESKARLVETILESLPERYAQVLDLRFLKGYTLSETANALRISIENVKITQHRALAKAVQIADELA